MFVASVLAGLVVGRYVEDNALYHRAAATALFLDSVVAPLLQSLSRKDLGADDKLHLDALWNNVDLATRIPHFEVWLADGTVAYSRSSDLIGKTFPLPQPAEGAFGGNIEISKADLSAREHSSRGFDQQYLEIYAPLHEERTGRIIGVMELHEDLAPFKRTVDGVVLATWAVVLGSMLALFAVVFRIVRRGARTIDEQNKRLTAQLVETNALAERNASLHKRAVETAKLKVELHENLLRSIGMDLHDGPVQLLAYASVKVEAIRRATDEKKRLAQLDELEGKLRDAQDDIRDLATGFVLPEIERLSLRTVVAEALANSERRTGVAARPEVSDVDVNCSKPTKTCVYRFLQEGLSNVWNHGSREPPMVAVFIQGERIIATIVNKVARDAKPKRARRGLGIKALKIRAETVGGEVAFEILGETARLVLSLPIREPVHD